MYKDIIDKYNVVFYLPKSEYEKLSAESKEKYGFIISDKATCIHTLKQNDWYNTELINKL